MKLIATVKLRSTSAQASALLATMEKFNEACNWLAGKAFDAKCANQYDLHALHYRDLRTNFGLSAQMAVRCIGKVVGSYMRDKSILPTFKSHGAIPYDQRILTFKEADRVSILTLAGRETMSYVAGDYHRTRLQGERGQSDLVLRKGRWYLFVSVEVTEAPQINPDKFLGVDLGVVNLAMDSDGNRYTGSDVERTRVRLAALRRALQICDSYSARRHLRKIGHREANYRADVNHCISKAIVATAKDTERGIGLEDLKGIHDRVTVKKAERARIGGWAFYQMRLFITYKAKKAGIPVVLVDPRNTSRTCTSCGYCAKNNRKSRDEFVCKSCGFTDHADHVGAVNIARRATVNWPIVSSRETGIPRQHRVPRGA